MKKKRIPGNRKINLWDAPEDLYPKPNRRFFIVFYLAMNIAGSAFAETSGSYLNCKDIHAELRKKNETDNLIVTNIIELSESDAACWLEGSGSELENN